jgi:23S rRNA (adenine2030-N6)-methyltransferase
MKDVLRRAQADFDIVLIDPPYERREEYRELPETLQRAWSRWPAGGYLLWYPLLAENPHVPLLAALASGGIRKILVHELNLFPEGAGLRGSGLLWINPPWQADQVLRQTGDWLAERLGGAGADSMLEWRVPE